MAAGASGVTIAGSGGATPSVTISFTFSPTFSKAFGASSITVGSTTSLTFTITNPNGSTALTGLAFSDVLPAGLSVATPNGLTGSCGGGTITAVAGSGSITLSGATIAANTQCTFSVNVVATTAGAKSNTTSPITSTNGGTGNPASRRW
jgi:uncharacterized repeat protein (TIGR01451 family)